jgi:hypothetical protein
MTCELQIMDGSGHLTLSWDPADPETIARAEAEFERLKAAGYAFFATPASPHPVEALSAEALAASGALDVRPEKVKEFHPRRSRTVAVRPMVGG